MRRQQGVGRRPLSLWVPLREGEGASLPSGPPQPEGARTGLVGKAGGQRLVEPSRVGREGAWSCQHFLLTAPKAWP